MSEIRVRSVAAGWYHSLALTWDGRVYSWGGNNCGQLGHGDELDRLAPVLVEGLVERGIAAAACRSLAVTELGELFRWREFLLSAETKHELRPIIVEGFGGVRVRRVCDGGFELFAIGEDGEVFSWGRSKGGLLGHGDEEDQPSPKRAEALRGVRVSSVSVGYEHALALAEDVLVYAWGKNEARAVLGNPHAERELLPKPVKALRSVRVGSIAAAANRSYALADTGELWAWGCSKDFDTPLGQGEYDHCRLPKPIESLRGVKVDAVVACSFHTLAVFEDGSVYAWGNKDAAKSGLLGLGPSVQDAERPVRTPRRIAGLRVATCGL
jgi:alpha-tubulin suppressor-like RCC1 family protein